MNNLFRTLTYCLFVSLIVFFSSCGKDDDPVESKDDRVEAIPNEDSLVDEKETPVEVIESPEETKSKLVNIGLNLQNEILNLSKTKGMEAMASFVTLMDEAEFDVDEIVLMNQVVRTIKDFNESNAPSSSSSSIRQLRTFRNYKEVSTPTELWEAMKKVTYTYNSATKTFIESTNSSEGFTIIFPSSPNAITNDAVFTIDSYKGHVITNQEMLDEMQIDVQDMDLPEQLLATLTVEGKQEMSYVFQMTYDADDLPAMMVSTMSMAGYVSGQEFSNTGTQVSSKSYLKKGSENLVSSEYKISGDVSWSTIQESISLDDQDPMNVMSIEYSYAIYDVALQMKIADFSALSEAYQDWIDSLIDWEASEDSDSVLKSFWEFYVEGIENLFSDHVDITMVLTSTNQEIAKTDLDLIVNIKGDDCDLQFQEYCYVYPEFDAEVTMTFTDGSIVSAEDFFTTGFDEVIEEFVDLDKKLIEKFNPNDSGNK